MTVVSLSSLTKDNYKIIFSYLKPNDLSKCRLVCKLWDKYLGNVDFRLEAGIKESPSSFCFFLLTKIPRYRELKNDFGSAVQRRRAWNLFMQPESLGYMAELGALLFFIRAYKLMKADMYAPSMDELRTKLVYFIGPNASNEKIMSYLRGETWALRGMFVIFPVFAAAIFAMMTTGSLMHKDDEETKSAKITAIKRMKDLLLLPLEYSNIEELKPYIDSKTGRVMHIPIEIRERINPVIDSKTGLTINFKSELRDLVGLIEFPKASFASYSLRDGYNQVVFRKDIYDKIQGIIKQIA